MMNTDVVGIHVRSVFDVPRQHGQRGVEDPAAFDGARREYGIAGTNNLHRWRRAAHWSSFVPRIDQLLQEHAYRNPNGLAQAPLRFYLSADTKEAYEGLAKRFPTRLTSLPRECRSQRCDDRDCESSRFALADLMNLARTKLILGSGWSSFSEVAGYLGGADGLPLPMLLAGRDFGQRVEAEQQDADASSHHERHRAPPLETRFEAEQIRGDAVDGHPAVQTFWPKPFT